VGKFVEFELGSETIVRLSVVHIFIDTMAAGPFFRFAKCNSRAWIVLVDNAAGSQSHPSSR